MLLPAVAHCFHVAVPVSCMDTPVSSSVIGVDCSCQLLPVVMSDSLASLEAVAKCFLSVVLPAVARCSCSGASESVAPTCCLLLPSIALSFQ